MATPFQDFLREREYTGPPLVVSREWPPTDGTDFIEVANEDSGAATVHRGCLVIPSDQGVPTWTWAKILRPREFSIGFILTYYGAQLRGGSRILMYCQIPGREFLVIEAVGGMNLPFFLQYRADVGSNATDEAERLESISYQTVRQVLKNHEGGVYHGDLDVSSVIVDNYADKKTYGRGDVHLVGYQRKGTVSDRFRDENMGVRIEGSGARYNMRSALEGNDRLVRAKSSKAFTTKPRLDDPLAAFYECSSLDYNFGKDKPAGKPGLVGENLLDRYHLADTVFRIFGGDGVDSPKPPSMPDDLFDFLVGLSTPDIVERFHPKAKLKKHPWMKRRAAIAAAFSKGSQHTDAKPTRGEAMLEVLGSQPAKIAPTTTGASDADHPSDMLVDIVPGTGGGRAAAAEPHAGTPSAGPAVEGLEAPPGSSPTSGSGSRSGSGPGSWWGSDSRMVVPTVSESCLGSSSGCDLGSGSDSRSGSGSGRKSGSGSALPTVPMSGPNPSSRQGSYANFGETRTYFDDDGGRSSHPTDTCKGVSTLKWEEKGLGEGTGKGARTKKSGEIGAAGGTRVTPSRSTATAAKPSDSKSGSGSASGSSSGSGSWWGSGSKSVLPTSSSGSDSGSRSGSRSGSGSWRSGSGSALPTVPMSVPNPSARQQSCADLEKMEECFDDGGGRSSRPTDTGKGMGAPKWEGKGRGEIMGKGARTKKSGENGAARGTRVTPPRSTATAAKPSDSKSGSGSAPGSISGSGSWWESGSKSKSVLPNSSSGSDSGSRSGLRSGSGSWRSGSRSALPTVPMSVPSPSARQQSCADLEKTEECFDDGGGRSSRPTDTGKGMGAPKWEEKGRGEIMGKGARTKKSGEIGAARGTRVTPPRSTATAAKPSDSKSGSGSASGSISGSGSWWESGSKSKSVLPTSSSGSDSGSRSGLRSGSGSWRSGSGSALPTVPMSVPNPSARQQSCADLEKTEECFDDGGGRSSRPTDTGKGMGAPKWEEKGRGEIMGKGARTKKSGENGAAGGTRVTPSRSTATAAEPSDSKSGSGSAPGSISGSGSWWESGAKSKSVLPNSSSGSDSGSRSGLRSGSGSWWKWWKSGTGSALPTVPMSGPHPSSRQQSCTDLEKTEECFDDGGGRSSRPTDTGKGMGARKGKSLGKVAGHEEKKKKSGEIGADGDTRVTPTQATATAAGPSDSKPGSGSASGSSSGSGSWWRSGSKSKSASPTVLQSGPSPSSIVPTVSESEPGSRAGSGSAKRSGSRPESKPVLPTVSKSGTSPSSRQGSWADSRETGKYCDDDGGRSSRPTDAGRGVGTWGWKVKGSGEGTGRAEGKNNSRAVRTGGGTRVTPTRSTAAAADISKAGKASAETATINGTITNKRKSPESDAGSDGSVENSRKRCRISHRSDRRAPPRATPVVPVGVVDEARAVPGGSSLIRPFMGSNIVELYSPSDFFSIAEPEYDDMEWCWGSGPEGIDNAGSYPDAHSNSGSSGGGGGIGGGGSACGVCVMGSCVGASFPSVPRN